MNQKGVANTYALQGGTQAWKSAGYPMEGPANAPKQGTPYPTPVATAIPSPKGEETPQYPIDNSKYTPPGNKKG